MFIPKFVLKKRKIWPERNDLLILNEKNLIRFDHFRSAEKKNFFQNKFFRIKERILERFVT